MPRTGRRSTRTRAARRRRLRRQRDAARPRAGAGRAGRARASPATCCPPSSPAPCSPASPRPRSGPGAASATRSTPRSRRSSDLARGDRAGSPTPSASWRRTRTSSPRCAGWPRPASGWSPSRTAPPASPRPGWRAAGSPRWSSVAVAARSIRAWKPAREVYLWAAGVCGVAPDAAGAGRRPRLGRPRRAARRADRRLVPAQRAHLPGGLRGRRTCGPPDLGGAVDALLALPAEA